MQVVIQLVFNSLIAGSLYALIAAGFSMIYATNKFIHFAHGAVVTVGAYTMYQLLNLGLSNSVSIFATILFCMILGYVLNKAVYSRLRKQSASAAIMLISSICLLILLESIVLLMFGANLKTLNVFESTSGISLAGAHITSFQLIITLCALGTLFTLYIFMRKTSIGKAMRAVSNNPKLAEVVGISAEKIYSLSFMFGSGLAAIAGILIGIEQNLDPMMGSNLMIKALAAAVIGGVGNVYAGVLGAFFLAFAENFGIWYLPSGFKDAIAFTFLFTFLIFRPQGIMGQTESTLKVN